MPSLTALPLTTLIFLAVFILLLIVAAVVLWRASKHAIKHIQEKDEEERRSRRHARREARRQSREKEIAEAQKARKRGDRRPVVLVVDDSKTVVESIKKSLEDRQYRVVIASNGREAWSALQDLKPDIIVSDIEMPLLDGLALLRLVRSDVDLANLPVILMSANAAAMVQAGKQDGVSGLLAKPFEDRDLIDQIRFLLQEA